MIHFHGNLRSIEYWFRCLDVDGDGVLSLYELQLFYEEVLQRLQELSIECLSVENHSLPGAGHDQPSPEK